MRQQPLALTCALALLAVSCLHAADGPPARNAVFNGTFVEGFAGFGVLGPGYKGVTLSADKSQHAQTLVTEMIVSCPAMERTFTVYSTYLLQVRAGREYAMTLRMAGTGQFAFGAFEYDTGGAHLGNNYSDRFALTPEFQDFTFTYKPAKNATGIRPSIVFYEPTDGTKLDVTARLRSLALAVPADEFGAMCQSWPDYAKDDSFASYPGFTAAELKALQEMRSAEPVLPPYRPLAMKAGECTLTTSRVRFGSSVLPQRVTVLGQEVLTRPLELTVLFGGGERPVPQGPATVRALPNRVELTQRASANGKPVTISAVLHYDGLLTVTLDFGAARGASLKEVAVTLPFANAVARYISYDRPNAPGGETTRPWVWGYGPIPAAGERVETRSTVGSAVMGEAVANDWKPAVPPAAGLIWEWKRGFLPLVWIGDEARGLSFMSLTTQGYRAGDNDATAIVKRQGKETTLTCRLLTQPVALDKPRRLQFALQIMPPKPVRHDWLATRCNVVFPGYPTIADEALPLLEERMKPGAPTPKAGAERPYLTAYDVIREQAQPTPWQPSEARKWRDTGFLWYSLWARGARPSGQPTGGCSTPLVGYPERFKRLLRMSDLIGHLGLPYFGATHIAAEDPAGYTYVEKTDEWTQHPRVPRPPYLRPTCPNSLFAAYMARGIGKMIDDYGISGVYFDNCAPMLCQNQKHGCGYVDESGKLQPTLPLLGFRQLFLMVRNEFVTRGKEPFILTHAGMYPGSVSFTDVELQGEGTYGSDHTEMFTLGEWRTRWLGQNQFGVQMTYLTQFGYGLGPNVDKVKEEIIGTPRLLTMALLHGTQVWNEYVDSPLLYKAWTVLDEVDGPDAAFLPYWQWPAANQPLNAQGVYASAYRGKERLVLVLSNLTAEARDVAVPLAALQAQCAGAAQVADHMHDQPVTVDAGLVKCTIAPKNFRLLSVTP